MKEQRNARSGLLAAGLLVAALAVPVSAAADHDDDAVAFAFGVALGSVLDDGGRRLAHPVHVHRGWRPGWESGHRYRIQRWHGSPPGWHRAARHPVRCLHGPRVSHPHLKRDRHGHRDHFDGRRHRHERDDHTRGRHGRH